MDLIEAFPIIQSAIPDLVWNIKYNPSRPQKPNFASGLRKLKATLIRLSEIDFLRNRIEAILQVLTNTVLDEDDFTAQQSSEIGSGLSTLRVILEGLLEYYYHELAKNEVAENQELKIKLPPISDLEDFGRTINDLKFIIQVPINDSGNGEIKVVSAQPGCIWLILSLSSAGVLLVGHILKAAAYFRNQNAALKMQAEYTRIIKANADLAEGLAKAAKAHVDQILFDQATAIVSKEYPESTEHSIGIIKFAIEKASDLIDKGAVFLPHAQNAAAISQFPDFKLLNVATSGIKEISNTGTADEEK